MSLLYPTLTDATRETLFPKFPNDVKQWSPDDVKYFLESRMSGSDYNQTDIDKIRAKNLTGRAFLRLNEMKLMFKPGPFELEFSPAEGIMELVEELKEKLEK
ncbi:hypothetical protein Glove_360g22 [Diversispora epigaea]|uniref:Uncharacterized protein n=1 Tax=Diversispora epigaea TaxID=1348612 RepID=A0A397H9V6_9GLOM|nr:hypothetical protein Glove_360g22 [Diversispora epigaea]